MSNEGKKSRRFSDDFLTAIKDRVNIVELIGTTQPLKKAGKDHECCCPFHDEKSPSFKVNEPEQLYHCFGCGESGDVFNWMTDYNNMSFPDAVASLASMAGLELPKNEEQDTEQRKKSSAAFNLGSALNKILRDSAANMQPPFSESAQNKYQIGISNNGRYINGMLKKFSNNIDVSALRPDKDTHQPGLATPEGLTIPLTTRKGAVTGFVYYDKELKPRAMPLHPQYSPENQWLNIQGLSHEKTTYVLYDLKSLYWLDKHNDINEINAVVEPQSHTQLSDKQLRSVKRGSKEVVFVLPNDRARASAAIYSLISHLDLSEPVQVMPFSALKDINSAKSQYLLDFTFKNWERLDKNIEPHINRALEVTGLSDVKNAVLNYTESQPKGMAGPPR